MPKAKPNFTGAQLAYNRARSGIQWAILVRFTYTWLGIILFSGYMLLVFGIEFFLPHLWPLVLAIIAGFLIGASLSIWVTRRLLRFFNKPNREPDVRQLDPLLLRDALNAPLAIAVVDFFAWSITGPILGAYLMSMHPDAAMRMLVHGIMSVVFTGQLVALFSFYALEFIQSKTMWPYLFQNTRVSSVPGVIPVHLYTRIFFLVVTTSVIPMVFFYLLELLGDSSGPIFLVTLVIQLVNGIWQGTNILAAYSRPLGRLTSAFARLRQHGPSAAERIGLYRADSIGRLAEMFDDLLATMAERDFIRSTFSRYLSHRVVDRILSGEFELGGSRYDATVLFADIRGFTSLAESKEPETIVAFLNDYLERMVQAITAHNGIPDKFIGDGILAVWGVPVNDSEHAANAVRAALDMLAKLAEFNCEHPEQTIKIGIGIHSGPLIAGNIGSKKKMEFTVIGDTVNTCSRIEAMNKDLGTTLAITGETYARLPADLQKCFAAGGKVTVRGRASKIMVYTLQ